MTTTEHDLLLADEHGIQEASYTRIPAAIELQPTLLCTCGKSFSGLSWEEAGAEYDYHLSQHGKGS